MAHSNNQRNRHHRGPQNQGPRGLPKAFDKGEQIELSFSEMLSPSGETFVGVMLSDRTIVVPGTYEGEGFTYEFVPRLDGTVYLCSVMDNRRKATALPVHHAELSREEWVRSRRQRQCLTAELVFQMSEERGDRVPRPVSTYVDTNGRRFTVFIEREFEHAVQLGTPTRVFLSESPNLRAVMFGTPAATKPVVEVREESSEPKPEQPADPAKVVYRRFEPKPGLMVARKREDAVARDIVKSVYEMLSEGQLGILITATSAVPDIQSAASRICRWLRDSVTQATSPQQRNNTESFIDGVREAERRALKLARAKQGGGSQARQGGQKGARPQGERRPKVQQPAAPQGMATLGDVLGSYKGLGAESEAAQVEADNNTPITTDDRWASVPMSPPYVAGQQEEPTVVEAEPEPTVMPAALAVTETESHQAEAAPAAEVDEFSEFTAEIAGMAKQFGATVEQVKRAIVISNLGIVGFGGKPKALQMHYVRQAKSGK